MKKIPYILAATALLVSSTAFAAGAGFAKVDANGDGRVTFEEISVAMPEVSEEIFKAADINKDGALSQEEYSEAMN